MTRKLVVLPEAAAELNAAADWYEARRPGLGLELVNAVDHIHAAIETGARGVTSSSRTLGTGAENLPVARFPYWVVFILRGENAVVVAYAHEKRRPGYWRRRARTI